MSRHFSDRLLAAIDDRKAPVCVGLDPVLERLPEALRAHGCPIATLREFGLGVIEAVAEHVPAVKINSAFFERHRGAGFDLYYELVDAAARNGLLVIGDCKRGDIGHTAVQYAKSQFSDGTSGPDAVTLHSYLGADAIRPFADLARTQNRGIFVLVRTSNESAAAVQDLKVGDVTVAERMAQLVSGWAEEMGGVGAQGYDFIGAVVAARDRTMARQLRVMMPKTLFLVPGYGAQGATADDIACCFQDGRGAIVNASRSVIFAFDQPRYQSTCGESWQRCVADASRDFAQDVARAVGY